MAAPRKYSEELKDRAMRMALDARRDPESRVGAIKRIADQLGIRPEALRTWVRQAEVDDGIAPGTTTADASRERDPRDWFGVEPICRVLRDAGMQIAPSTYYAAKVRPPSARAVRGH